MEVLVGCDVATMKITLGVKVGCNFVGVAVISMVPKTSLGSDVATGTQAADIMITTTIRK